LNARPLPLLTATATIALFITLAVGVASQPAPTAPLTLLSKDGRRSLAVTIVGGQEYVALDDLASVFQLAVRDETGAITVSYKGKTIILTPEQALASVSGRLVSLPAPPSRGAGRRWLVPEEFVSRALALIYDVKLDLRKPSRLLIVGDMRVPRITVHYDPLGTSGRLTIDATPRALGTVTQDGDHLTIKFDADALDASGPLLTPAPQGLVTGVRLVDQATLAVDLGQRFGSFRSTSQPVDTTMRIVIDVVPAQTDTPAPGAAPAATAAPAQLQPPPVPDVAPALGQPAFGIRTVALDPGHCGDDEGAHGASGVKEKDLTLSVARRAKATIEARLGIRVLMTREDDRKVPIDERAAIANNNKADLLISLHASSSLRTSTSGATIFCAEFDKSTAQAAIAGGVERVPAFGGGSRDIELVLWDFAQTRHLDQSTTFAGVVEQSLHDRVTLAARPVDHAPLRVLESANMPAVLIEMGYLTNPDQEKLIAGDAFQNTLVQGLYDAIVKYRDAVAAGGGR
jgi:N-acetylmuramoyl-L-alanine amidase